MYPYAVCTNRSYDSRLTFKNETAATLWLQSNINTLVYLEVTPDMHYLEAHVAAGLSFPTEASADVASTHYAITVVGIHPLQLRHVDGVLTAAPSSPLSNYKPAEIADEKEERAESTNTCEGLIVEGTSCRRCVSSGARATLLVSSQG